jgi:hypothetical protein
LQKVGQSSSLRAMQTGGQVGCRRSQKHDVERRMSTPFSDFLRQQAAKMQAEAKANQEVIDEWRTAIVQLFDQIPSWLATSDPDGIVRIDETQHEVTEPGLGRYTVPRLDLQIVGKWIGIIPKARKTVGTARPPQKSAPERATGRVDITDELRRYVLYRFPKNEGGESWQIDDLRSEPKPLDQQTFETALMSYLR